MHKLELGRVVVVALGGSIMFPDGINSVFLKKFNTFIRGHVKSGRKFVLVSGGGHLARMYQHAALAVRSKITNTDKDWLGIHATRSNAQLLRTIFEDVADPVVIDSQQKIGRLRYPVTVASGWRPGWSTDYIACVLADRLGAGYAVIAGKPAFVYDKDPSKHKNAKAFERLFWKDYRKLIPGKWSPGFSSPVDPVAARYCQRQGVGAIVVDGKDLRNLHNLLCGKDFVGTVLS